MTMPDERYRAVIWTELFLKDLCNPDKIARVPKHVRDQARNLLRHYPNTWEMNRAAEAAPDVFAQRMDDLHKFLLKGKEVKDENRT